MDRVPQRKYSPKALEHWFQCLTHPWEELFSAKELEAGRRAYRLGEVRSIELAEDHAIIHGGRSKDDVYAVVDWPKEGGANVRHSVSNRQHGRSLAAAGMYEIEEFVAEEVAPLPLPEEAIGDEIPAERAIDAAEQKPAEPAPLPGRPLRIQLRASERGLRMTAQWTDKKGRAANAFRRGKLSAGERESLIALTTRAHKVGFEPRSYSGDYILRDTERMASFVRRELPKWRRRFKIETDASVTRLGAGVREVELHLQVQRNGRGLRFEWQGRLNGEGLGDDLLGSLLRHPNETVVDAEHGLVRLVADQSQWVADWQPILEHRFEGVLPFYMLFSLRAQREVPVMFSDELEAWGREVESGAADLVEKGLLDCLRPYQRTGVKWLKNLLAAGCHPLLADEMGLGKTLQVLNLFYADPEREEAPSLIVCPASVLPVWEAEAARFFPDLELRRLQAGNAFDEAPDPVVWLASYTQLRRHRDRLGERTFRYAILDEAQVIKNPDAKVTQACWAIQAKHRLAMTGTPIENRHLDVWAIFRFLMPGLLGARRAFEDELQRDELKATVHLRRQLAPFVLRRTKAEVGTELPAKIEMVLPCPLTDVQVSEYKRLVAQGSKELGEQTGEALKRRPMPLLSLLTRLRQTCCDPGLLPWRRQDDVAQSGKLLTLCERLDTVTSSGRKAVVFSQFTKLLDRAETILGERFPDVPRFRLDGSTRDRSQPVEAFQNDPGSAIMMISLKAGGTGITLHAADYVFLLDPWWNPAVEAQAIDRVHRIGQTRQVMVYRLVTRGTVEERIEALKEHKRAQFDAVVGGMDGAVDWATQFTRLSDLIAYRDTA